MLLSLIIGEFVSPPLEEFANANKAVQLSGSTSINSEGGTWRKIGVTTYTLMPLHGGEQLIGVSRYRINERRELKSASFAESGEYVSTADGGFWRMVNVSEAYSRRRRLLPAGIFRRIGRPTCLRSCFVCYWWSRINSRFRPLPFRSVLFLRRARQRCLLSRVLEKIAAAAVHSGAGCARDFFCIRTAAGGDMGFRIFVAVGTGLVFTLVQRMIEPVSLIYGISPLMAVLTPVALLRSAVRF